MGLIMTTKGRSLIAEAMTNEVAILFTKMETTEKLYAEAEAETLEFFEEIRQEVAISEVERTDETTVTLSVALQNLDLTVGYYIRGIGIYAKKTDGEEILFGVAVVEENADYMPMYSGKTVSGIEYKFYINVGNAENVLIEVNPDNFVTFEKFEKLEDEVGELQDEVGGLKETVSDLSESVKNDISESLDLKYDKAGGEISGSVRIGGGLDVVGGSIYTSYGATIGSTKISTWSGTMYDTDRMPNGLYTCMQTPHALILQSSQNTDSYYDKTDLMPIHIVAGNRTELTRGLLVYGDKIIYNNEELATKTDVAMGMIVVDSLTSTDTKYALSANQGRVLNAAITSNKVSVVNGLTSTSTTSALSAYQGNVLNSAITSNKVSVVNSLTSTSTTSALSAYQGKLLNDKVEENNSAVSYDISRKITICGGQNTVSTGNNTSVFGCSNDVSSGYGYGIAIGSSNVVTGYLGMAIGFNCTSNGYCMAIGNQPKIPDDTDKFVIGIGTGTNGLRIDSSKYVYGGTYNSSGADYAEYFEWLDGNPSDEDRIGRFVTIRQGKIQLANADDSYIVGVISGNGSIIGDAQEDEWSGRFEKDIFGRVVCEWQDVEYSETELVENEDGEMEEVEKQIIRNEYHMKENPEMNKDEKYIPRSQRSEWDVVGLMGKLIVIDDGTCAVDGFCDVGAEGIATEGDRYLVMERLDSSHIKILLK
ncbi:MAG: peptidase G2 autoproteolytic cleavage domain-containing protein [Bacillota bacterium]